MTPERWQKVKEVCQLALESEPSDRDALLAACCLDDHELRREVEDLLTQATASDGILDAPIWDKLRFETTYPAAVGSVPSARWLPETIGRYRVLRMVGEGGMGSVYEAEQDHPRRAVALKVIKPGLTSPELLRRFERESQALGRLQHPGIAQIYEAGAADTGFGPQPYFAMEFIVGEPLKDYVTAHQLQTRQRLELVARICDAVQHAHERGLIHRDLKPGNILVDPTGQPKILDFGVARLTDGHPQATLQTDLGQLVGTLAYMSPEQVLADPLELDTRSDVYALGVILYELLAGRLPYATSNRLHEAVQAIREEEPRPLSSISRNYRGDVETIVAKALEKDKARRYSSAAALAADIRRHLADEPITARPASAGYQLEKFARRHKAVVTAAAVVFVVLVGGIVVSTRAAVKARRAEQAAQAVNDFLQDDLLAQASASTQAGARTRPDPDLKVRTALDRAATRIDGKFEKQPEAEAAIRDTIGQTYIDLGLYTEARGQLERALALHQRMLGAEDTKTLKTMRSLGRAFDAQGKYVEAVALLSKALEIQRRLLGSDHPDTLSSMYGLARVYRNQGKYLQAEVLYSQTLDIRRRVLGPQHPDTLASMTSLAGAYFSQGKYAQAEALFEQSLEIQRRVLGPEHPTTLFSMVNLASTYNVLGKYAQAEPLYRQNLEIRRRILGPEHPDTLQSVNNLANVYNAENKYDEAEALYSQNLEVQRRVLGREHPDTLYPMSGLANIYIQEGKYPQAEALYSETLEIQRRVLGQEHPNTLASMINLADSQFLQGKYSPAEALFSRTLEISRRVLGPEHAQTLDFLSDCASMYQRQGKFALAESYSQQALTGHRHAVGSEDRVTMASAADLALAYLSQRKFAESEPLAREVLEFDRKKQPDDWQRFRAASLLGASLAGQKKYGDAEPLLIEGYQGMAARKDRMGAPDRYHLERGCEWLIQLYQAWGKPDKAAEWRQAFSKTQ
jgi:tetratricopeptide (TPR) repeat protein